jgi:2,3-bisphosphoglycerate-independent phosphoglycerate mutase
MIFDGWGLRAEREANAIAMARTPTMDRLCGTQAHTELDASGEAVGLAPGVMGNSEVGHLTIGAGRVIYQDVMRISKAIETGAFARNEVLLGAIRRARDGGRTLHVWGLLSDASVHSHINHLFALLELATVCARWRCTRCSTGATRRRARRCRSSTHWRRNSKSLDAAGRRR